MLAVRIKQAVTRAALLAAALAALIVPTADAIAAQKKQKGPSLIRDAEIEGFLRQLSKPIFKAAKLNPNAVTVYLIADDRINAFVAGGQRIFINTGLFTKTKSPEEIIGVLAHETGHIANGHLSQLNNEMAKASTQNIIGMLIGAAAIVGSAAAGSNEGAKVGQGILMGSGGIARRNMLSYQRSMEASADQAALRYLNATGNDPEGMLTLFQKLANDSIAALDQADPYMFSHPMPLERIRTLEKEVKKSPYYGKPDDPGQVLRYELARAKLIGFMQNSQKVFQRYPSKDNSLASRYARSIALFRRGDIKNAMPLIDSLTEELPQNPYFWELKAQAYLENAQAAKGIPAIKEARKLLPNNGLLQMLHAQILIATNDPGNAGEALKLLTLAKKTEAETPALFKFMAQAHALKGDLPRADLATAEFALMTGDRDIALAKAKRAQAAFKRGTPEWLKANDILLVAERKKK